MPKTAKKEKKRIVLLDTHAIIHRAFHALPEFTTSRGEPTGALYGLAAFLMRIVSELKPDYIVAAYDLPGPTYRHEAYKEYKAKRPKLDPALISQIKRSREIFEAFGIPIYEKEGFEADDILGTLSEKLKKEKNLDVVIASGDMDTLQLVDTSRVRVFTLRKGLQDTVFYDEDAVVERFGFSPEQLPDYKGLRGDPSDNIVGVRGIGEKTATALIKNFGTVDGVYKALKDKKSADKFSKVGITPRIQEILKENEEEAQFSKMLATIHRDAPIAWKLPEKSFRENLDLDTVARTLSDFEFRSLVARAKGLFGTKTLDLTNGAGAEEGSLEAPEEVAAGERKRAAVALWLLNSDITNPTLDDILLYGKTKKFSEAKEKIFTELKKQKLEKVYKEIEEPLIPILEKMEARGVLIDIPYLKKLSKEYHHELDTLGKKIYKLAGEEFNINSPRQLGVILFDKLGLALKNHKKTAGGQRTTKESELEKLREEHAIIGEILSYRELAKLLGTYIDAMPELADRESRIHTTFLQAGSATGRMATKDPGLQNIPIRSDLGRAIRHAFIAPSGYKLLTFDYSQIELRIAAWLSGDEKLTDIFRSGRDVHAVVAAQVFNVPEEQVDYEMRRRAKVINFGILYGMGVNALRANLGTDRAEAQKFLNEYFKNFATLARYLDHTKADAERKGYTETYYGRRRYFAGLKSPLPYIRAQAERMAINAPIQGTEADIVKLAMIKGEEKLKDMGEASAAHLLLQVHDELVYEVEEKKVKAIAKAIKEVMENILPRKETSGILFEAVPHSGRSWGELQKIKL